MNRVCFTSMALVMLIALVPGCGKNGDYPGCRVAGEVTNDSLEREWREECEDKAHAEKAKKTEIAKVTEAPTPEPPRIDEQRSKREEVLLKKKWVSLKKDDIRQKVIGPIQTEIDSSQALMPQWYRTRSVPWISEETEWVKHNSMGERGYRIYVMGSGSYNDLLVSTICFGAIVYVLSGIVLGIWYYRSSNLKSEDQEPAITLALVFAPVAICLVAALAAVLYLFLIVGLGIVSGEALFVPYPFLFCLLNLICIAALMITYPVTMFAKCVRHLMWANNTVTTVSKTTELSTTLDQATPHRGVRLCYRMGRAVRLYRPHWYCDAIWWMDLGTDPIAGGFADKRIF